MTFVEIKIGARVQIMGFEEWFLPGGIPEGSVLRQVGTDEIERWERCRMEKQEKRKAGGNG
jgi:hypothetical protein